MERQRSHTRIETTRGRSNGYLMTWLYTSSQCVSCIEAYKTTRLLLGQGSKAGLIGLIIKTSSITCLGQHAVGRVAMCMQQVPRLAELRADLECHQLVCAPQQTSRVIAMSAQTPKIKNNQQRPSRRISQGESNHTSLQTSVGIKLLPPEATCINQSLQIIVGRR